MKNKTKLLGLILALVMAASAVACADAEQGGDESSKNNPVASDESYVKDNLPDGLNYDGASVVIHTRDDDECIRDVFVENAQSQVDQAIYERNEKVQDRLNVKLENYASRPWQKYSEAVTELQASIGSADGAFDIIAGWSAHITGIGTTEYLMNLHDFDYLDFDQPWWNQYIVDELTFGNTLVFATGDITLTSIGSTQCFLFNKKLQTDWGVEDLYQTVLDGKWTFDKLNTLVKAHYYDDGDSVRNEADSYGLAMGPTNDADAFLQASGIQMFTRNENGIPEYTPEVEKLTDLVSRLYDLLYNNEGTYTNLEDGSTLRDMFMQDKALLNPTQFLMIEWYISSMESDYGIIPYPKYDEAQEKYLTRVQDGVALFCIPVDAKNSEMSAAVMEAMAAENYRSVSGVYYNVAMKNRYSRDDSDVASKIMDMIMDGRYFNFACIYNNKISRPWDCVRILMENRQNSWATWNAQYANSINIMTERLVDKLIKGE